MRKLLTVLALLLSLIPATAQFDSCLPGVCGGAPATGCTQSASFLARTSGLDAPHRANYTNLICGLVTDGVWTKLDVLQIYATQDQPTALLNLVSSSYAASTSTAPWTVDRGFAGLNIGPEYVLTGFTPSTAVAPQFTLNSAHISYWNLDNNVTNGSLAVGSNDAAGANMIGLHARFNDGNAYFYVNSNPGVAGPVAVATPIGHSLANRSSASSVQGYKDGSSIVTNNASTPTGLSTHEIYVPGQNNNGTAQGVQNSVTMFSAGGGLTPTDVTNFYTRLHTYMTAVGL